MMTHALFLTLTCALHPEKRALFLSPSGAPACGECADEDA